MAYKLRTRKPERETMCLTCNRMQAVVPEWNNQREPRWRIAHHNLTTGGTRCGGSRVEVDPKVVMYVGEAG